MENKCQQCGKIYKVFPYRAKITKFCSRLCHNRHNSSKDCGFKKGHKINLGKKKVKRIEKIFKVRKSWNEGKGSPKIAGANNWRWKSERTKQIEEHLLRSGSEFKRWRKAVYERDNFTCQKYGTRGGTLHPHHIYNFADYPELRFDVDNGITLSYKAHREFHKRYGIRNNTKEQIKEFLQN